ATLAVPEQALPPYRSGASPIALHQHDENRFGPARAIGKEIYSRATTSLYNAAPRARTIATAEDTGNRKTGAAR
ncbi:MAG TPA: hypothetical protein PLB80_08020, partial [Methanoculleus sp.]|nr:hypothetical protein [Methanoculleus sp.]